MDKNGIKYGLTYPQKNIWLVDRFYGNTAINVIAGIIEVQRNFSVEVCKEALNILLKSNEGLRLRISEENGEPVQYVSEYKKIDVDVFDMTGKNKREIKKLDDKLTSVPFEIIDSPLYYFAIVKESDDKGYMYVKLHHLVSDAWTFGKIGTALANLVDSIESRGEIKEENPSYIQYIDSEKEYVSSDKFQKDKLFWDTYLEGITEPVGLKEESNQNSIKAKRYTVKLDKKLNSKIKKYCMENKVSPYTVFMNALAIYMHRVTEKTDFVIGTPVLNRSNFNEKQMMGMFVSTMPVRFKINEKVEFLDMCKNTAKETMSLFRHQKYPYSLTLENFRKNSGLKDNIYKVMISYQNARAIYGDSTKYSSRWNFSNEVEDDFAMHITDMDETGNLEVHFDYKKATFEDIEIKYIASRIFAIIEDGIDNNKTIEDIEIMTKEEKNKILYEFNDTKRDYPRDKTVIDLFEEQVNKTPDNIALVFEGKEVTYKELNERANQVANYLVENGIYIGDIVGVYQGRQEKIFPTILGVLKAGAIYLPIDSDFPDDRIDYMIENSKLKTIIYDDNVTCGKYKINCWNINSLLASENVTNIKNINESSPDGICYVLYTSGSTGNPKGVKVTNRNVVNFLFAMERELKIKDKINFLCITTISFDIFVLESLFPLSFGHKIVLTNSEEQTDYRKLATLCIEEKVDFVQTTPSRYGLIMECEISKKWLEKCKYILIGGETVKNSIVQKILDITNAFMYNVYGPTETTVWSTLNKIITIKDNDIGKPISNTNIYILDNKMRMLPMGIKGVLYIGGDSVTQGYLNNEELTSQKYKKYNQERVYNTGDIVELKFYNSLNYIGRKDFQVKINGHRIELGEIEDNLIRIDGINEASVIVIDNKIIAYLKGNRIDKNKITNVLNKRLPNYMIPNKYIMVEEFVYTNNGKIDKLRLKHIVGKELEKNDDIVEYANSKYEMEIEEIINGILDNNERININTPFVQLGLDSIQIIKLSSQISKQFRKEISFAELFNSNIKKVTNLIMSAEEICLMDNSIKENGVALSDTQKSIFSYYIMNSDSLAYNMSTEIVLSKNVNISKLVNAINETVNRHNIFKMTIEINDNKPVLRLNKNSSFFVDTINSNEKEYKNKILKGFIKPFDLLKDRLIRVKIVITENKNYILFDTHHIIFDGISINLFIKEIQDRYQGKTVDNNVDNKFVEYLNGYKSNKLLDSAGSMIEPTYIEKNINEEDADNEIAGIIRRNITDGTYSNLIETSKKKKITVNSILLSAFKILLSKYTYNDELSFGVVTSGRTTPYQQEIVGMFSNTQVYNTTINWDIKSDEFVKNTLKDIVFLMSNEQINNSSINIVYAFQNIEQHHINVDDDATINSLCDNVAKFDISLQIIPISNKLTISLQYRKKLYSEEMIRELIDNYEQCINSLLENINSNIKNVNILDKNGEKCILNELSNEENGTTYNRIEEEFQKEIIHDKLAVIHNKESITYGQLNQKAGILANNLIEIGVNPNDVISVCMNRGINYIISILGILKAGAVYLPIDPNFPDDRINFMMENSHSKHVITSKNTLNKFYNLDIIYIEDIEPISCKKEKERIKFSSEEPAYIMYTSGTSGEPKGTINTHKGVVRLVKNNGYVKTTCDDNVALTGTISFDASVFEIWTALLNGCTLHILDKEILLDPNKLNLYLSKEKITIVLLTTSLFTKLAMLKPDMFKNIKYLLTGGDVFSAHAGNNVLNSCKNINLINAYGPTEASVISTVYKYNKFEEGQVSIGKPVKGINVYVLDRCGNILPKYAVGQIYVGGTGVGKGYINNESLTKDKFIKTMYEDNIIYNTGDLGQINDKYEIIFKGRRDGQIKIRGYRIEIDEIKNNILKIKGIRDVHILVKNKNIYAFVVTEPELEIEMIREELRGKIPNYMMPRQIYKLEQIPLTLNGKVDLKLLGECIKEKESKRLPTNELEMKIYEIWQKILNNTNFGITDNFFDIGGDSILATEVVLECSNKDLNITYSDLYNYPTIQELCNKQIQNINEIYSLDNIDLKRLNCIAKQKSVVREYKGKDIILTGATGFLGAHILYYLLKNHLDTKIYCLVRSKDGKQSEDRLSEKLQFFFGNSFYNEYSDRIIVIDIDLSEDINLEEHIKNIDGIGIVINSAAYVKHYDSLDKFIEMNVETTRKIAKFSKQNNIKFYHVSTLSVSGNMLEAGQVQQDISIPTDYTEEDLYLNQKLYNGYAYSKFLAEVEVLKLIEQGLEATILRMGNLTGRYSDGKFQPNVKENAFANRIRAFMFLKSIPENLKKMYLEFTPIDYAASAIEKIIYNNPGNRVLHLFNDNHIYMREFILIMNKMGINIDVMNVDKFKEALKKYIEKKEKMIEGIIIDLDKDSNIEYISNITVKSDITKNYLQKLGFKWPIISEGYIVKYFEYLIEIGFLDLKRGG